MKFYNVYILLCADGSYYTGITSDVEKRLIDHNSGRKPNAYTYNRRPVELVWSQSFTEPVQAILFEKKIKKWSRAKKEALINGAYEMLSELSECKNISHYMNHIGHKKKDG
ncbi:putative endonuclease [Pustulibacterium marinum]|uniref:Putative endonuclease n=1 Tax=Pustulibacterium marinum TaxID=1224947 RepID=A0A1I7F313_9FLAO|nr:GIY-YIG nuclease family protein [Pustulibacterium marinum]SFU30485.1 putative endonuclease [Pustulibacterium marinum]